MVNSNNIKPSTVTIASRLHFNSVCILHCQVYTLAIYVKEWMHHLTQCIGKACHFCVTIWGRSPTVAFAWTWWWTAAFSWDDRCSIGFKSGEHACHCMTVMPCWTMWLVTMLVVHLHVLNWHRMTSQYKHTCHSLCSTYWLMHAFWFWIQSMGVPTHVAYTQTH